MEELILKLRQVGLTDYEAKSYICLLTTTNVLGAAEVSRFAKVPRTKIYDVLRSLIQKGFCIEKVGKIRKYKAINPKYAFDKIYKELENKKKQISNITKDLSVLVTKIETNNSHQTLEIIREENRIIEKIDYLTENAVREIIAMKKPPFEMESKNIENGNHIQSESSVKFRYIYEIDENENPEFFNLLQIFQNEGAEIKLISSLPVGMEIYDDQVLRISLKEKIFTETKCFSIFIQNKDLIAAFRELFQIYYKKAETLKRYLKRMKKI